MTAFTNHHLTVEHVNDKSGPAVMLTQQEGIDDAQTIIIHPWQLVAACHHLGLTASDPQAEKTIRTLQTRLLALKDRIDHLGSYLALHSDHRHADLDYETNYATATADICDAYCADFAVDKADQSPTQTQNNPAGSDTQPAGLFELVA